MQLHRNELYQPLHNHIGRYALTGGSKRRHDAMAQNWLGDRFDVFSRYVKSSLQQRIRSSAENQILSGSRTSA